MILELYCDGSCSTKTKKGAYGVIGFLGNDLAISARVKYNNTTNNRMELQGLLESLGHAANFFMRFGYSSTIHCDSLYSVTMFNSWIYNWHDNDWTKADRNPIMNEDIVKDLWVYASFGKSDDENNGIPWKVVHTKGHAGILKNELADALATGNLTKYNTTLEKLGIKQTQDIITVDGEEDTRQSRFNEDNFSLLHSIIDPQIVKTTPI